MTPVYLNALSNCVPDHEYPQSEVLGFMLPFVGSSQLKQSFIKKIYEGTGITKRYSVLPDFHPLPNSRVLFPENDQMDPEPKTAERNAVFCRESVILAQKATRQLLETLKGFDLHSITHLITVSCTGFAAPGFDYYLIKDLGLNPSIHRFHIGFMGCFAAFPALKMAKDFCLAQKDARVLIVDVELCSLHFQKSTQADIIVANALFADGAAAALVSTDPHLGTGPKYMLNDFGSRIIPNSEEDMAWVIGEHGFDMKLSSYVPKLIESHIAAILDELFDHAGWNREALGLWAIHPGGRAILDKAAQALNLDPAELAVSYDTLRDYGNMSSVTIFFVLKRLLETGKTGRLFTCAFGPGLTVESALMELLP